MTNLEERAQKLMTYIADELENVSKLQKQLNPQQAKQILHSFDDQLILDTLLEMENYKPLSKKYRSVSLTLKNWMKLKMRKEEVTRRKKQWTCSHKEALDWLAKNGHPFSALDQHFEHIKQDGKSMWRKRV